jgi:hypothetical protein
MGEVGKGYPFYYHPDGKHFQCTCGDWRSNETASFMEAIGMDKTSSNYADFATVGGSMTKETLMHYCPWVNTH